MKLIKILIVVGYFYFTFLLLLITLQYIPLNFEVTFLKLKQEEVKLSYYNIAFFTHVYTSIFLVLIGWIQFWTFFRKKYTNLHRLIGKFYILIILMFSGPSALIMGCFANGGIYSKISFIILSILWLLFTYMSYSYAKNQNFREHQKFAIRSFALTLSAISLRLFKYIIVFLFHPLPMDTYRIVSWLGWVFNLIIAEIIIIYIFRNKIKNGIKIK
ncbi:DUF2306 domain-containing protein [Flavobacterium sp. N2270]|jgi:uncharacterized membrane protein|uniref:DUF2306 domain-containing protein n=1 Tax=Flavobacterium sp. N2270 TaxID=2986831 RepID=UPI0022255761|nr:DUF2306 domain-containing protein [Flavobacterium sp. N2270]